MMESGKAMKPMSCSSPATKMSCTSSSGRPMVTATLRARLAQRLPCPASTPLRSSITLEKILMLVR